MSVVNLKQIKVEYPLSVVDNLYEEVKDIIKDRVITPENIIQVVITCMKLVEQNKNLSGSQKKVIVLRVVELLINDIICDDDTRKNLEMVVTTVLPNLIDVMKSLDIGKISIKIKKKWNEIFTCCKC